jgi:hypothetical protein
MMNCKGSGKEAVSALSLYDTNTYLQTLQKVAKDSTKIVNVPAEIRTGHLQNTSQKRYGFSQPVWWKKGGLRCLFLKHGKSNTGNLCNFILKLH